MLRPFPSEETLTRRKSFPLSTTSAFPAFLLGAALTAVLFLSLIGFTLRRTNVLETSLVFVYVVVRLIPPFSPQTASANVAATRPRQLHQLIGIVLRLALGCRSSDGVSRSGVAVLSTSHELLRGVDPRGHRGCRRDADACRPRQFGSGWLSRSWAVPKSVPETSVSALAKRALTGVVDSVWDMCVAVHRSPCSLSVLPLSATTTPGHHIRLLTQVQNANLHSYHHQPTGCPAT